MKHLAIGILVVAGTCLFGVVSTQAQFWNGFSSGFGSAIEAGKNRRANQVFMVPGDYEVLITRAGINRYAVMNGGPNIRTRFCFHGVEMDEAILRIEAVKGGTVGELIFSDGTACTVNRVE